MVGGSLQAELSRQEAIHALITSEEEHVRDLTVLRDVHMKKFKESNLLSNDQFSVIFSNIVQVLSVARVCFSFLFLVLVLFGFFSESHLPLKKNFSEVLGEKRLQGATFGNLSDCLSQMVSLNCL